MRRGRYILGGVLLVVTAGGVLAQQYGRGGSRARLPVDVSDRKGVPDWKVDADFKEDLFTFVRVKWTSYRGFDIWSTDFPDAELNFSFRLQQVTSMKVAPQPKALALTDEEIFDHPFIYMLEVGSLTLTDEEVVALRRHLLNGGFLMVDDFWGVPAWENFYREIKRVFPDAKQEPQELPLDHEIFRCVYELKEKPQIPGIDDARMAKLEGSNRTWERWDAQEPHYKAIFDDKGRMMVMICHNTDLGDGWEREGEEEWYFKEFSEKKAYPLGINIVFYAMTH
jgi:hypothetical protein